MNPSHRAGRSAAFARSAGRCEACGLRAEEGHHRKARGMGGSSDAIHSPANFLALCPVCHRWAEANPELARGLGLKVLRNEDPREVPAALITPIGEGWFLLDDEGNYVPTTAPLR